MRWSEKGINTMLAPRGYAMILRVPDLLDWRANQALAA